MKHDNEGTELELHGAGSLPVGGTVINLSYSLVRLTATDEAVTLAIRSRLVSRIFRVLDTEGAYVDGRIIWSVRWDGIQRATLGPKSVIFWIPGFARNARFAMPTARRFQPLRQLVLQRLPCEQVSSTMFVRLNPKR